MMPLFADCWLIGKQLQGSFRYCGWLTLLRVSNQRTKRCSRHGLLSFSLLGIFGMQTGWAICACMQVALGLVFYGWLCLCVVVILWFEPVSELIVDVVLKSVTIRSCRGEYHRARHSQVPSSSSVRQRRLGLGEYRKRQLTCIH